MVLTSPQTIYGKLFLATETADFIGSHLCNALLRFPFGRGTNFHPFCDAQSKGQNIRAALSPLNFLLLEGNAGSSRLLEGGSTKFINWYKARHVWEAVK